MIHSNTFGVIFVLFCLLFIFFCFDTAAAPDPGPPTDPSYFWSHLTQCSAPALSFQNFLQPPSTPSLFLLSPFISTHGALACAACVLCVRVCVPCVYGCEGVCVCWLGLGVTLACLLHTTRGISSLVFKPQPPVSISKTQPPPR